MFSAPHEQQHWHSDVDPTTIFELLELLGKGSYGLVYVPCRSRMAVPNVALSQVQSAAADEQ